MSDSVKKYTLTFLTSDAVNELENSVLILSSFRGHGGKYCSTRVTEWLLIYLTDNHQTLQCLDDK